MMDVILGRGGGRWTSCLVYLDGIVVYSKDTQQHLKRLQCILQVLQRANLKLKLDKCSFVQQERQAFGHRISGEGIRPDSEKIKAVKEFPKPAPGTRESEQGSSFEVV